MHNRLISYQPISYGGNQISHSLQINRKNRPLIKMQKYEVSRHPPTIKPLRNAAISTLSLIVAAFLEYAGITYWLSKYGCTILLSLRFLNLVYPRLWQSQKTQENLYQIANLSVI